MIFRYIPKESNSPDSTSESALEVKCLLLAEELKESHTYRKNISLDKNNGEVVSSKILDRLRI